MKDLALLFQQLAMAAHSGFPFREVLAILRQDGVPPAALLAQLSERLDRGSSLGEALAAAGPAFAPQTVDFVRAAEGNGVLPQALEALAADYSRRAASRRAVLKAISWPAALAVVLAMLLFVVMVFVIPAFRSVYADLGGELPAPTRALVEISDFLSSHWWWLASLAAALAISLHLKVGATRWIPLVQPLRERIFALRLAALMALAHATEGRLASPALAHLHATAPGRRARAWVDALAERLQAGPDLLRALRETPAAPRRVVAMLDLGAKTGNVEAARAHIAGWCEAELEDALARFETEALLLTYVVIGVALGTIVFALYLPIFRLGAIV